MSASARPAIPRPRTSAPPAAPRTTTAPPPPASGPALIKAGPARERFATLDLEDADIVGIAVAPIQVGRLASMTSRPPSPRVEMASKPPPPPASEISLIRRKAAATPAAPSLSASRVPSFDAEAEIERGWDEVAASVEPPAWASPAPAVVPSAASVPPAPVSVATVSAPPPPVSVAPVSVSPPPVSAPPPPVSILRPVPGAAVTPAAPPAATVTRLSISDPTDLIFDGMYGLAFARGAGEAAEMCAETLARALGARTVVVHTHDLMSRELRAIGAHGDGDFDIIGSAEASEDDLVASAVICNQKTITMRFDGELPRLAPKRLHAVGAPRTVVAAPAIAWGRCLAIIEVIDPDERFAARVADSAAYVAGHFAQFLSTHAA